MAEIVYDAPGPRIRSRGSCGRSRRPVRLGAVLGGADAHQESDKVRWGEVTRR